jgi:hypothetical protein
VKASDRGSNYQDFLGNNSLDGMMRGEVYEPRIASREARIANVRASAG